MPAIEINAVNNDYGTPSNDISLLLRTSDCRNKKWQTPEHDWYEGNRPCADLLRTGSRPDETVLGRLRRSHTRAQQYVVALKVYPPYPNFNVTQATPVHILPRIGCYKS
ncbi:hypothetical protein TNCV_556911 [Trichonephila clavipes]|uniref:Uncharacterized protein n=1 Tax=Trichonephila clavipes TaxID=2585209 RepID=A0A8X6UY40_TRICX|nr:hypothetical protein TNCV_556911 [Trichonephila clavipes]